MYIIYCLMKFNMPLSTGPFHQKRKPNHTFLLSPSWYCTIYNYIYWINFYISARSSSTEHMFCKPYRSHLRSSHVLYFFITKCLQKKRKSSWCPPPPGHHNIHIGFVTIGHTVQNFRWYRQTEKDTGRAWRR